ncbi:unnamed protein product [Echinostoma caproni]|uniref:Autophagy-related protein 9 n=1 Tax=Echinostoma caproni TaxID=27848 RepID=A0A183AB23_9TREM|nr:unnamed protein product [Echinostoma caproni]
MESGLVFYNQTWERFAQLLTERLPPAPSMGPRTADVSVSGPRSSSINTDEWNSTRSELLRLFRKQEYFRRAYNDTLSRMDTLASILPAHALPHLPVLSAVPATIPPDSNQTVNEQDRYVYPSAMDMADNEEIYGDEEDVDGQFLNGESGNQDEYDHDDHDVDEEEEEDIELSPELVEFMMQTIKHREERDRLKHTSLPIEQKQLLKAPPPKPSMPMHSSHKKASPIATEIGRLETALLYHYEYCSIARDAPFWPFMSSRV